MLLSLDVARSGSHDSAMEMQSNQQLRSANRKGRPTGSFGDPVARLRVWWWLAEILNTQNVTNVKALWTLKGTRARFANHDEVVKVLQEIELDGYGPDRDSSPRIREVFKQVAKKAAYAAAHEAYNHPIWTYLSTRTFPLDSQQWMCRMLASYGLLRIEGTDESHGERLGLIASEEMRLTGSFESETIPWPGLHHASFTNLDGLLLLVMLMKEAEDEGALGYVQTIRDAIREARKSMGDELFGWHSEARDTWSFIAETRLATWTPSRGPSQEDKMKAWKKLDADFEQRSTVGRAISPSKLTRGRSERRWRRRAWACAAVESLRNASGEAPAYPKYFYGSCKPHLAWLVANRDAISVHVMRAITKLVVDEEEAVLLHGPALKPLTMPKALMDMRSRPGSYCEHEAFVFGDAIPYDVIEVEAE